jgi:hypothetical protein
MNKRQKSRFSMLINVQQFMWRNRPALGAVIWSRAYAAICEAMNEVVACATAQWVAQALGLRLTQTKAAVRDDLRTRNTQPIAAVALETLADKLVFARLEVPRKGVSDAKLLAAASAMAAGASRHRNVFLRAELPADFIPKLRHTASEIQRVLLERSQSRTARVTATQGIEDQLRRASGILPTLDAQVVEQLAGQPALLAEWEIAMARVPVVVREAATPPKPGLDAA